MKRACISRIAIAGLALAGGLALAQEPVRNVDPARHGNLAAAQSLVQQAYDRLGAAQAANDDQLGGHAARAKELLREANDEIKMAAVFANRGVPPPPPSYVAPPGVAYLPPNVPMPGPGYVWAYHPQYGWGWNHPAWGWQQGWY